MACRVLGNQTASGNTLRGTLSTFVDALSKQKMWDFENKPIRVRVGLFEDKGFCGN